MSESIFLGNITVETIIISLILSIITIVIGNAVYLLTRRFLDERINKNFSKVIARLLNYVLYFIGFYLIFNKILGLNLSALWTAAGIATIIIGLSTQQTFQNIIAGIIIAVERPIRLGDWVELGGFPQAGLSRVRDITLFRTVLRRYDGSIFYAPNANLITTNIINYTKGNFVKVSFNLDISADSNLEKAEKLIIDVCRRHPEILPNIPKKKNILDEIIEKGTIPRVDYLAEKFSKIIESGNDLTPFLPKVLVKGVTGSKITLEVWVRTVDISRKDEIVSDLLKEILKEFKKNKIKLPQ
ncbi:MAG: mechanosensitive ion channel family protein [Candidatus Aenigmarchaeota archaeon]|nr:mechanosensitive ion channel family protein [Candidatus Aenigmarchaeota archaeon]